MNDTKNIENNDSKKIITLVVLILTVVICTTSATYAYFAFSATNNNTITGTAASVSLTLSVSKNLPTKTNTGVLVPQLETALASALSSGCVDANTNVVCQVYTITVTNASTSQIVVNGSITFAGSTNMPNLKWRKMTNASTLGSNTTNAANTTSAQALASSVTLKPSGQSGNVATYYIIIWINETGAVQTDKGTYTATVSFTSSNGTGVTSTITS